MLSCFAFQISVFLSLFFPYLKLCVFVLHQVSSFKKKTSYKRPDFCEVGGCNKRSVIACVLLNMIVIVFWPIFEQNSVDVQKKTKNRYFSTS